MLQMVYVLDFFWEKVILRQWKVNSWDEFNKIGAFSVSYVSFQVSKCYLSVLGVISVIWESGQWV